MTRLLREEGIKAIYHIYDSGTDSRILFENDSEREYFLSILEKLCKKTDSNGRRILRDYAHCLMDNHFHLLVHSKDIQILSKNMQVLKSNFVKYIRKTRKNLNQEDSNAAKIFEDRFKCVPVNTGQQFWNTLKYILSNPIKAGITNRYDYQWSSYRYYYSSEDTFVERKFLNNHYYGKDEFDKFLYQDTYDYKNYDSKLRYFNMLQRSRVLKNNPLKYNKQKVKVRKEVQEFVLRTTRYNNPMLIPIRERIEIAVDICKRYPYFSKSHIAYAMCVGRKTLYNHLKNK